MWWISGELVRGAGVFAVASRVFGNAATGGFAIALFLCGCYWLLRFVLDCAPLTLTDEGIGLWSLTTPRHKPRLGIQWAHVHSLTLEPESGFRRARLGIRLDGRSYEPIVPLGQDSKAVARKIVAVATTNNWRIRVDPALEAWLKV